MLKFALKGYHKADTRWQSRQGPATHEVLRIPMERLAERYSSGSWIQILESYGLSRECLG